jgi:hypothetical protein
MKFRIRTSVLACLLAGAATELAAQDDCSARTEKIATIGDVQAALSCMDSRISGEVARSRQQLETNTKQLPKQLIEQLELVTTTTRHVVLKESTNGKWKQIPESLDADACFLSSVKLPPQGLCQVTHQGTLGHWSYNVSDPASAGFLCTATCVWLDVRRKPQADTDK